MTIDEAIAHARDIAAIHRNNDKLNKTLGANSPYYKTDCLKCAEEHEQLAEWLKELKAIKEIDLSIPQHFTKEQSVWIKAYCIKRNIEFYNKALDDFIHECDKYCGFYTGNNKNLTREDMLNIAEQLKVGGENDKSI